MRAKSLYRIVPYCGDTLVLFQSVVKDSVDTQLFESMDGNGQNNTQSLLFVQSAMCIEAQDRRVTLRPLTPNGRSALNALLPSLEKMAEVEPSGDKLVARFPDQLQSGPDMARVKAPSTADVLRLASQHWDGVGSEALPMHLPGIFAYDFIDRFETLPKAEADPLGFVDFVFWLPERVIVLNHIEQQAIIVNHLFGDADLPQREHRAEHRMAELAEVIGRQPEVAPAPEAERPATDPAAVSVDLDDDRYGALVERCKEHIVAGDVFQIVPSRTFSTSCTDPLAAYSNLRQANPSPYLFFVRDERFTLFGSSPETCVSVKGEPKQIQLHPIAGTRPRGLTGDGEVDLDLDNRLEAELKLNEKELAEHMMLVDLARNDVARISRSGSRRVLRLLEVERYSQVMHLVSVVEGTLQPDLDAIHAYVASMNMGTLVGAPKIEAARLLRRYEKTKRGPYGGSVGYFNSRGELDVAIVIRAAWVVDQVAHIRAGAGVVFDSDPLAEAQETRNKAKAVLKAIQQCPCSRGTR